MIKRFCAATAAVGLLLLQAGCHHEKNVSMMSLPEHPALASAAGVNLPHIFGDHMVLQADMRIPVWGSAVPNEAVTVRFEGQSASTRANANGQWQLALNPISDQDRGEDFTVTGDHGDSKTFHDVLVGEVWLGSGQSNMERKISQVADAKKFIAEANQPSIRLFTVKRHVAQTPASDVDGQWEICTPETIPSFSAVLYHFGLDLQDKLHAPMGLIHSSWGGTPIQAWIPAAGFSDQEATVLRNAIGPHPRFPNMPSVLYNGMIAPVTGYAMRGAIWYQGESDNSPKAAPKYGHRMETMVDLWRDAWGEGAFPFYFVEIAPYNGYRPPDTEPIIWQQQEWFARHGKNTGMAATGDIGDLKNIHPMNKHEVGRRLALIALAKTYGFKDITYEGPSYRHIRIEGNEIRVHFNHAKGLKTCDGQPPKWFEIAGPDGHFMPAKASIDGDDVIVSSSQISDPQSVRMGWSQKAEINLCNAAGLPATPFQSGN